MYKDWNGFKLLETELNGRLVKIVFPNCEPNGKLVVKTEYFEDFPNTQIALVEKGYHLIYIANQTRWHVPEDTEAKKALIDYMADNYSTQRKAALIGMSCGGLQAIYFASKYPEYVACMHLDAPVVNFLSCPGGIGKRNAGMMPEFTSHTGMTIHDLMTYRNHPYEHIPKLIENKIPVILVAGDSDMSVPFDENGIHIKKAYEKTEIPFKFIMKPGCGHHPHGLEDPTEIVEFIEENYKERILFEDWHGFRLVKTQLDGRNVQIVLPNVNPNGKLAIKTEYFDAFPNTQIALLEKGYHLAYIENKTRWFAPGDEDAKAKLVEYMAKNYGTQKKAALIGMSCGGLQAIYFASKYPQYAAAIHLDAPVVNYLSCPAGVGKAGNEMMEEFIGATGMTLNDLTVYRNHPLDNIHYLVENKIPVILVAGDSDGTVPYDENGIFVKEAYEKAGLPIKVIVKPGCDHHPHGLEDPTEIVEFIEANY